MPGIDELLVVFELAQDVGDMSRHYVQVFAHGLKGADIALGHSGSELQHVLPDSGEEG